MVLKNYSAFTTYLLAATSGLLLSCSGNDPVELSAVSTQSPASDQRTELGAAGFAQVNQGRLDNAATEPQQWLMDGGTYDMRYFSPLDQIDRNNIGDLGLAWYTDYNVNLSQQGAPLFVDGVLYVSTAWSMVNAYDARTGALLWHYDPQTPREIVSRVCCGIVNRGIAAYDGHIYLGTLDGYLVAINAESGEEDWRKLTVDPDEPYTVTSAPHVIKGQVLLGNSGSEKGVRGYIGAYDAETGEDLWRFYTVPGNPELGFENEAMELAAETWSGNWWELGGGGTVWDAIVYDDDTNLIMFGTGNGTPWDQRARDPEGGDNLFIASILAVDADTGEYAWHYQATPGDTWDYDAMSPMMLADLEVDGELRHVLMQPNKNGMFYMLDAASGELLRGYPFTEVNWNTGIDMATGRPIEVPEARYDADNMFNLAPGVQGGHGWHSNSYNPETGYIYIATQQAWYVLQSDPNFVPNYGDGNNLATRSGAGTDYARENPDAPSGFVGYVSAWDPVSGEEIWRSEENPGPTGGVMSTAGGLVFSGGGNNTNEFRAYDTRTGEKLWSFDTQTGMVASPITFELDGKQYMAASVGINQARNYYAPNYSRLLVFTLGGTARLPEPLSFTAPELNPPALTATPAEVAAGGEAYSTHCSLCHGNGGLSRGANFPNLLVSPMLHSQEGFDAIVLAGARLQNGMVSFADRISASDTANIRAYLTAQAIEELASQSAVEIESVETEDVHTEGETAEN